jgi:hypothetical protein
MREWVDLTDDSIIDLQPRTVLEVGGGAGLLLLRVALLSDDYAALDFSPTAIARVQEAARRDGDRAIGEPFLRQHRAPVLDRGEVRADPGDELACIHVGPRRVEETVGTKGCSLDFEGAEHVLGAVVHVFTGARDVNGLVVDLDLARARKRTQQLLEVAPASPVRGDPTAVEIARRPEPSPGPQTRRSWFVGTSFR